MQFSLHFDSNKKVWFFYYFRFFISIYPKSPHFERYFRHRSYFFVKKNRMRNAAYGSIFITKARSFRAKRRIPQTQSVAFLSDSSGYAPFPQSSLKAYTSRSFSARKQDSRWANSFPLRSAACFSAARACVPAPPFRGGRPRRSEEHTSELQSQR